MKNLLKILTIFLFFTSTVYVRAQDEGQQEDSKYEKVTVYYFHNEKRCITCRKVEQVSRQAVAELYKGKVKFRVYNLDEDSGKEAAAELGVDVQSLVIENNGKLTDITTDAFLYANNNAEKLKSIIKGKIDQLL